MKLTTVGQVTVAVITTPDLVGEEPGKCLEEELNRLLERKESRFVLDFGGVLRLGTLILAKVVAFHNKVEAAGGRVVLCGFNHQLRHALEVIQVDKLCRLCPSQEEALRQAAAP
jgi:anti-anti-sigma regulatory factor